MTDQKAHLKAFVNAMIEKDDAKAGSEFHAYLASKMQGAMEQIKNGPPADTSDE